MIRHPPAQRKTRPAALVPPGRLGSAAPTLLGLPTPRLGERPATLARRRASRRAASCLLNPRVRRVK
ncbi:MAG: hypothetical protein AAGG38_13285 [Planctomycetota bacterium]